MDISALEFEEIVRSCVQQSERYFRGQANDSRYCFELFRRAFEQQDKSAWEHIYTVYQPLVSRWVSSHPAFEESGEEIAYFVNRAFEKIWYSIPPAKFSKFTELSALLSYLKMCVSSVLLDFVRGREKNKFEPSTDSPSSEPGASSPSVADQAIENLASRALWAQIKAALSSKQEYLVVYACYVLDLKPREILAEFPGSFIDIREIYRIKENFLDKLRKNNDLIQLIGEISGEMD